MKKIKIKKIKIFKVVPMLSGATFPGKRTSCK